MSRALQILSIALLCGMAIALVVRAMSPGSPTGAVLAAPAARSDVPSEALALEVVSNVKPEDAHERVVKLESMVQGKRQQAESAEKTRQARSQIQFVKRRAWAEVINANRQTFEELRKRSIQAPEKLVPCTICDTKGVLELCVVCDHSGKCPTCSGTGKQFGDVCATCSGRGKCFLCFGSGNMPCPFCQALPLRKEVITPITPEPRAEIPIE